MTVLNTVKRKMKLCLKMYFVSNVRKKEKKERKKERKKEKV